MISSKKNTVKEAFHTYPNPQFRYSNTLSQIASYVTIQRCILTASCDDPVLGEA